MTRPMLAPEAGPGPSHRPTRPDAELIRRVRSGDREAYSTLVRRYQEEMFRYARGIGLDYDAAQDTVQEAFLTAYVRLDDCRDPGRFRQWLMRIVRNACLDYHRDIRRRTTPLEILEGGASPTAPAGRAATGTAVTGGANLVADRYELRLDLTRAFGRLSPLLRDAVLLKFQAGYTYDEMAELAGTSASAMKMRVQRARQELRDCLGQVDEGPM